MAKKKQKPQEKQTPADAIRGIANWLDLFYSELGEDDSLSATEIVDALHPIYRELVDLADRLEKQQ